MMLKSISDWKVSNWGGSRSSKFGLVEESRDKKVMATECTRIGSCNGKVRTAWLYFLGLQKMLADAKRMIYQ